MVKKSIVMSTKSFADAELKAKMQGYTIIGKTRNRKGQYVLFVRI